MKCFVLGMEPEAYDRLDVYVEREALEHMSTYICVEHKALEHMKI